MKKYVTPELAILSYGTEENMAAELTEGSKRFNDGELEW